MMPDIKSSIVYIGNVFIYIDSNLQTGEENCDGCASLDCLRKDAFCHGFEKLAVNTCPLVCWLWKCFEHWPCISNWFLEIPSDTFTLPNVLSIMWWWAFFAILYLSSGCANVQQNILKTAFVILARKKHKQLSLNGEGRKMAPQKSIQTCIKKV